MNELYDQISILIKEITYMKACERVAVHPLNEVGLLAKTILENCYGYSPIIVDNELANYNGNILSIEQYKKIADSNDVILICVLDPIQNQEYVKKIKQAGVHSNIKNILSLPIVYHAEKEEYFKELKKLLLVRQAVGFDLKRYGRHHDGGYVMLDDFQECHIAYSFGINDDISWDEQIAGNGLDVFCYDHTINALPKENPRLHFNKIGIGVRDSLGESLLSLDTILYLNKCQNERKMILKMDTEGAEWGFIRDISSETLLKFSQIIFEFHNVASLYFLNSEETLAIFEKLNQTHQVVWIHANNFGAIEQSGDIIIPDTIEITYANKNQYQFQSCEYNCPLIIDEPNYSLRPDIELKNFGSKVNKQNDIINDSKNNVKFFLNDVEQKNIYKEIQNTKFKEQISIIGNQNAKISEQNAVIESQNTKINEQNTIIENQNAKISEQNAVIESQNTNINEQNTIIENQNAKISEQGTIIESLNAKLSEQNAIIESQNTKINEQNAILKSQNSQLNEQYSIIENKEYEIEKRDSKIYEQNLIIENQSDRINEQISIIKKQTMQLSKESLSIQGQNEIIQSMREQIEHQKLDLESLYNSKSWRITAPLRGIFSFIRKLLKGKPQV